jgi:hypothetical protein
MHVVMALALVAALPACSLAAGLDRFEPASTGGGSGGGGAGPAGVGGSGGAAGCATNLLISEARTRGSAGSTDDFVEIVNPTATTVALTGFKILARSASLGDTERTKWTGTTEKLGPGAHLLVAGAGFDDGASPDESLASNESFGEDTVLVLRDQNADVLDTLCLCAFACADGDWTGCPGDKPISNPNVSQDGVKLDLDRSLAREPECSDTDTAEDFVIAPSDAQSTTSP